MPMPPRAALSLTPLLLALTPASAHAQDGQAPPAPDASTAEVGQGAPSWERDGMFPIVITATREPQGAFNTPLAVTVLTAEMLASMPLTTTPDLLEGALGVYVQKTNTGGGSPFVRGMTGKQVLILVDGVRLNNSFFRYGPHQYLNTIDPHLIERIEVVRGPASVLYGSDALGGVIHIITRSRGEFSAPRDVDGRSALAVGEADRSVDVHLGVDGNLRRLGFVGGATARRFGDLRAGGDVGVQVPTAYDEVDADLKLQWSPPQGGLHVTLAQQVTRQFDVPKTSEVTLGDKLQFNYEPQLRALTTLTTHAARAAGPVALGGQAQVSWNHQVEGEAVIKESAPDVETLETTQVDTLGLSASGRTTLPRFTSLVYGAELYHDTYSTARQSTTLSTGEVAGGAPLVPDGATYQSLGVFLQDTVDGQRGQLVLGGRYSHYAAAADIPTAEGGSEPIDLDTGALTGSAHALVRLGQGLHLVGGVAQGFRAPNMEDFVGRVDFYSEIPNPDLRPERSVSAEIGFKVASHGTRAEMFAHRSTYQDLITRVTVGEQEDGTPIQQRQNIGQAQIQGLEGALRHTEGPWTLSATATWTEGKDLESGAWLRRMPPLNGELSLRLDQGPRLWAEVAALWASEQDRLAQGDIDDPRIGPEGTPGYQVLDLRLGLRPTPQHTLLLSGENLTNQLYKTHGSGVYAPGRTVWLSWQGHWGRRG